MMIKVKTLTGKTLELDIEPNDKVERIKERIEQVEGEPFVFAALARQRRGTQSGAPDPNKAERRARPANRPPPPLPSPPPPPPQSAGIPPAQQRLIFSGKQLADDQEAKKFNIESGSVLHLVLALRGGGRGGRRAL